MPIDYKNFLTNSKYKVTIAKLKGGPVSAVMQNDLSIGGGNDFTTAGEVARELPLLGNILRAKDAFKAPAKALGMSATSQLETAKIWNSSLVPSFAVEMTFYQSASTDESIVEQYMRLKSAVLPTGSGVTYKAPLGYRIGDLKKKTLKPQGTISLEIGEWFRATNMVMTSESFTFSKEVNADGQPLFITGSITVEPYKRLTYKEFNDYFIGI